ncbi:hypothetical protein [Vibrio gangliei]|uniref:hypothetical protein n=1 Tax=Vibrio gangliei TaxID=2077090 RepID=UPI000D018C46|nr:hypothetical protein [Vibrio gangliei]
MKLTLTKSKAATLISTLILFGAPSIANAAKVVTTEQTSTSSDTQLESIDVNGFGIELSEKDKAIAESFLLTNEEMAKFKYIMEYTPRKYWTPNISPIVALGAEAKSDEERRHYAELAYKLKEEREKKELQFARIGVQVEMEHNEVMRSWKSKTTSKFGFAEQLPENKTSLTSLFINAANCDASKKCKEFVSDLVLSNSTNNKLDIYFKDSSNKQITDFAYNNGIKSSAVSSGSITLNIENGEIANSKLTKYKIPFAVTQSNQGSQIIELNK